MGNGRILIVGSYNVGLFLKGKNIPKEGETLIGTTFTESGGGKGSNQAIAAKRLGGNAAFAGCIGNDKYGTDALKMYGEEKMPTDYIRVDPGIHTGISVIFIDEQGNNSIMVIPGANYHLTCTDIDRLAPVLAEAEIVGYQLENPIDVVSYGLKMSRKAGAATLLDPAPAQPLPDELYPYISIIKPNEYEASVLSGIEVTDVESAGRAGKWFNQKGVRTAVITLGGKGAVLSEQQEVRFFPAPKVETVDTTGAGDCFSGALMAALAEGWDMEKALHFAHTAAAISTTKLGVIEALPDREQVLKQMEVWYG